MYWYVLCMINNVYNYYLYYTLTILCILMYNKIIKNIITATNSVIKLRMINIKYYFNIIIIIHTKEKCIENRIDFIRFIIF